MAPFDEDVLLLGYHRVGDSSRSESNSKAISILDKSETGSIVSTNSVALAVGVSHENEDDKEENDENEDLNNVLNINVEENNGALPEIHILDSKGSELGNDMISIPSHQIYKPNDYKLRINI